MNQQQFCNELPFMLEQVRQGQMSCADIVQHAMVAGMGLNEALSCVGCKSLSDLVVLDAQVGINYLGANAFAVSNSTIIEQERRHLRYLCGWA